MAQFITNIEETLPALRGDEFTRTQSRQWSSLSTALALAGMMCIPILLSYFFFAGQSLRLDEAQSLWQSSRSATDILTIVAQDVHVPLYHELLHFWRLYFGDTITAARVMSLGFYLLSIPALYFLGKLAYSRNAGLFATFLFSISPFMNWYGNEIRMYTLFTFFVILNQYFFVKIFKGEANDHVWAGYALSALFGVFSHYFFFLNLAGQAVFYFVRRGVFPAGSFKRFVGTMVLVVAAFIPWAWYVFHLGTAGFQEPILPVPTSVNLFSAFSQFLFGFQNDNINTFFLSLWPLTIIFALVSLRHNKKLQLTTEYLLITVVVSVALAFFGSFIVTPFFVSRYLIFTVPSLYLLLASLFTNYSPRFARAGQVALAALMVVMMAIEIANPTTPVKENYQEAVNYINTNATVQDSVVLSAPFTVYPVEYYYKAPAPLSTLPEWNEYAYGAIPAFNPAQLPQQVKDETQNSQNVFLLLSYDQGYEKNIKDYFDSHYKKLYEQNFSDDLNLYVYQIRYGTSATQVSTTMQ